MRARNSRALVILGGLSLLGGAAWLDQASVPVALAQERSPEGRWRTIDDSSGEPKSIVRMWIERGTLRGRVETLFRKPGEDPNLICDLCSGEKKDQPVKGMTIIWGLTRDEGEANEWNGGYVLDPENGKTYRCIIRVDERGEKVHVRGYIGFSLIGRTQTWERVE